MKPFVKSALAVSMAGALTLAAMTPSLARSRTWAAVGAGFVAGTILGAAAADANARYYSDGPYAYAYPDHDGYAYAPHRGYRAYGYAPRGYYYDYGGVGDNQSYDRERQLRGSDY